MDPASLDALTRASWNEVRAFLDRLREGEASRDSDPQPRLASEFFELFLIEQDPIVRRKALNTAFVMWGNTTSSAAVDEALAQLDPDADYWPCVLHCVSNAYARSGRRDDILPKLQQLEAQLTHEKSRVSVLLALGRQYLFGSEPDAAKPFYSEVYRIASDRQSVNEAESALYEIRVLRVGLQAPRFEAETLEGERVSLDRFRGSVVCLEFWESDCGPCWAEFPTLRALREELPPPALRIVGVSSDRDSQALTSLIRRERLAWSHIREPVAWQDGLVQFGPLRRAYNVWGVPSSFVIDEAGRIAALRLRGPDLLDAVRGLVLGS